MSYQLNEKLKKMTPYEPSGGTYRIRLDANESFVPLSGETREELMGAFANTAFNRYPDPLASEVCRAFAAYYGIAPELVTAGNGSDELISVILGAFLSEGEKLLTILPDFSMYAFYAELYGVEVISLEKGEDLTMDLDRVIETARREKVSCVIFSNPCNPTGQGLAREQVRKLVTALDCLVVLDEAYMDFYTESLLEEAAQYDNLILLRTCSKALGSAAVRLGFAVANPVLSKVIRAAKSPYNVNTLSQCYGAVVLSRQEEAKAALAKILSSRDALYEGLVKLQERFGCFARVYPTVTNFVFVKTDRAEEYFEKLKERSILVRRMGDFLRITAGSETENDALLGALFEIVA